MNTNDNKKANKNSFLKAIALFLFLVLIVLSAGLAYAKFVTSKNGTATATVAEFNFNLKNLQGDVSTASNPVDFPITRTDGNQKVQSGMIAPDTYGRFDMIIDSTGTQVSYRYDIEVTVTNCPTNLIFYTDKDHQNPITPVTRTGTGTEQDPKIATFTISKFVPVNRANEIHKEIVYWAWPYETGNTANEIHTNDLLDSADMEKMVTMAITVTGTQVTGQPAGVPMVGEQTTSVKDIVDIDLPAPGGQRAVTITKGQQLNVTLTYDNPPANIETVAVVSSDSSIVTGTFNTTTNKVVLNALKNGTATITLRGEQSWDLIGTVEVTVQSRVNELSLSSDNSTVTVTKSNTKSVIISNYATLNPIEPFTVTSSDSSIATASYDNNGTITISGVAAGIATITLNGTQSGTNKTINVTIVPLASEVLAIQNNNSPYVDYVDGNRNTIHCRVLYNDVTHGLQIISADSIETVYLGSSNPYYTTGTDLENVQNSYNNAIVNLNNKAESYINSTYASDARCVGSVPTIADNKDYEDFLTNENSYSYLDMYVSQNYKGMDRNFQADYNQLGALGIRNIGFDYWLASRYVSSNSDYSHFYVRCMGDSSSGRLWTAYSGGNTDTYDPANGFRPVFLLKSNVTVTGGSGTSIDPYILGVN